MTWDGGNTGQDVFFVDIDTGAVSPSAEILAFPWGGDSLDVGFTENDVLCKVEEPLSRSVEMIRDFSGLFQKIQTALDGGDLKSMEELRGQLLAMRDLHGLGACDLHA
ncbi:MAG: hypothetical protein K9H25_07945 [Rhodospirillum sp.]|nr:hypothetical protein [Rhodospirillum sp.]MCF8489789.1 hypothetical protein [Rhodospirillum sp.]MCF8500501.1 hypothetical protein [Rhodospirillum sp.]